ncbi:MAG TPA: MATE family efflux transporter [Planctomycetota bacterium]|nr:MATE family efflux transporter [Planctomycetota bacterium]
MTASVAVADPLLQSPAWRAVLRLGLPQALGLASHVLVNLVDLLLVGRLGQDAVAAAGVATTINFLPMVLGNSVAVASLAQLSQKLGVGDLAGARLLSNRTQWLMLGIGLLVSVATALPAAWCVDSIELGGAVRRDAIHYLVVSNLGCLPMFALMQVTTSMRAVGEVAVPLAVLLGANLLNLGLDLLWLFGWDAIGVRGIGVVGAAYATVVSRALFAVVGYLWLCRRTHPLRLGWPRRRGVSPLLGPLLWLALPQAGQIMLRALLAWALLVLARRTAGADAVAALGITTRLDTLVLFGAVGFGSAATTLVGRCLPNGLDRRARAIGGWAATQAALFATLSVALLYLLRVPIVLLFLPAAPSAVIELASTYLAVAAMAHPFAAFALGAIGALHGGGRMLSALAVDLAGFVVLGAMLAGGFVAGLELCGLYRLLIAGSALVAVLHGCYLAFAGWTRWPPDPLPR